MEKTQAIPMLKRIVGIIRVDGRTITFNTDEETVECFQGFGGLINHIVKDTYILTVDARYDFKEVLEYIRTM